MVVARGARLAIALIPLIALERAALACEPIAVLAGPEEALATLGKVLRARGVHTEAVERCPVVLATIGGSDGRWSVVIEDPHGRRAERTIAEIDLVATFIESWTRVDQEMALLAPRGWVPPNDDRAVDVEFPGPLVIHHTASRSLGMAAALETSFGGDRSSWFGVSASACVRLGPACAGVTARFAKDTQLSGESERLESHRVAFDLIIGADRTFRRRHVGVTIGAGFGLGWLRIGRLTPNGPNDLDAGGVRVEGRARIEIPLARSLTFGITSSLGVSPFAHVDEYVDEGNTIAGEPRWFARLGLGLTYGVP